jgi:hypothetical protein
MAFLGHITHIDFPTLLIAFTAGIALGAAVAYRWATRRS